jgi:hypothetical protein
MQTAQVCLPAQLGFCAYPCEPAIVANITGHCCWRQLKNCWLQSIALLIRNAFIHHGYFKTVGCSQLPCLPETLLFIMAA